MANQRLVVNKHYGSKEEAKTGFAPDTYKNKYSLGEVIVINDPNDSGLLMVDENKNAKFIPSEFEYINEGSGNTVDKVEKRGKQIVSTLGTKIAPSESHTYQELKVMKQNSTLVPGQTYRMTDYKCILNKKYESGDYAARSAGHKFDLLLTAVSSSEFDEVCSAVRNTSDDGYFASSNLDAWKIWYNFGNDETQFDWASPDGKGVIYRMIDEQNNDCPYDFKNVLFKGKDDRKDKFLYTFTEATDNSFNNIKDFSLKERCDNNTIQPYYTANNVQTGPLKQSLNHCYFLNQPEHDPGNMDCYMNVIGLNSFNIRQIGKNIHNVFEGGNSNIYIGWDSMNNHFGINSSDISLGNTCNHNVFGPYCSNINLGDNNYYNTFNSSCSIIKTGKLCSNNTWGEGCIDSYVRWRDSKSPVERCKEIEFKTGTKYSHLTLPDGEWGINEGHYPKHFNVYPSASNEDIPIQDYMGRVNNSNEVIQIERNSANTVRLFNNADSAIDVTVKNKVDTANAIVGATLENGLITLIKDDVTSQGPKGDAATIAKEAVATVSGIYENGNANCTVENIGTTSDAKFKFDFKNIIGKEGAAANVTGATASVSGETGDGKAYCDVENTGSNLSRGFNFKFHNIIGKNGITPKINEKVTANSVSSNTPASASFKEGPTNTYSLTLNIPKGKDGADGNSITSISEPSKDGLKDTYTINYSKSTPTTFTVTNGADGVTPTFVTDTDVVTPGSWNSSPIVSVDESGPNKYKLSLANLPVGQSVSSIEATGVSTEEGKEYLLRREDNDELGTIIVPKGETGNNGRGITNIEGTDNKGSHARQDITVTYTDGIKPNTFHCYNGYSPNIGSDGNWYIGGADTGVKAKGDDGITPKINEKVTANSVPSTQDASASFKEDPTNIYSLTLNIPRGKDGNNGRGIANITGTDNKGSHDKQDIKVTYTDGINPNTFHCYNGYSPEIGDNGNWYIGTTDTKVKAQGNDGESAYEIAKRKGFSGSEADWLISLNGSDGNDGVGIASVSGTSLEGSHAKQTIDVELTNGDKAGEFYCYNGYSPEIGTNGNWHIGTTDTRVKAKGTDGITPKINKIVTANSVSSDTPASASFKEDPTNTYSLTLNIPRGKDGKDGKDGTGISLKASESECTVIGDAYIRQSDGHIMILSSLNPRKFTDGGEIKGPAGRGITSISGTNNEGSHARQNITVTYTDGKNPNTFHCYNGYSPEIGANGNWKIGGTDTGVKAKGTDGKDGIDGITPKIIKDVNVTTVENNIPSEASFSVGSNNNYTLSLKIPKGRDGQDLTFSSMQLNPSAVTANSVITGITKENNALKLGYSDNPELSGITLSNSIGTASVTMDGQDGDLKFIMTDGANFINENYGNNLLKVNGINVSLEGHKHSAEDITFGVGDKLIFNESPLAYMQYDGTGNSIDIHGAPLYISDSITSERNINTFGEFFENGISLSNKYAQISHSHNEYLLKNGGTLTSGKLEWTSGNYTSYISADSSADVTIHSDVLMLSSGYDGSICLSDEGIVLNPGALAIDCMGKVWGHKGFFHTSDEKLKNFKEDISIDFNLLKNIPKKYFTWKSDKNGELQIGTSAQEVQKLYPEIVSKSSDGTLTVDYSKLSVIALKAVDELHDENERLKSRLEAIEKKLGL